LNQRVWFLDYLVERLRREIGSVPAADAAHTVFALSGLMELYDFVQVSTVLEALERSAGVPPATPGRDGRAPLNRALFLNDPLSWQIANEGVSSNNVEDLIADWQATADKVAHRAPTVSRAEQLLEQAVGIDGMDAQALAAAIKETEPKARRLSLPGATIHDEAELDNWLVEARAEIEAALAQGSVIL
jgi:hypothetical protein